LYKFIWSSSKPILNVQRSSRSIVPSLFLEHEKNKTARQTGKAAQKNKAGRLFFTVLALMNTAKIHEKQSFEYTLLKSRERRRLGVGGGRPARNKSGL
jgi:hypothetical protein